MKAWLFVILRNCILKGHRKRRRWIEDSDGLYAERLQTAPDQQVRLDVQDMFRALEKLRPAHREVLILTAAEGLSYEEAARICGIPEGTVKSRLARARAHLARLLAIEGAEDLGPDRVMRAALQGAVCEL